MKVGDFIYHVQYVWKNGGGLTLEFEKNIVPHIPRIGEWVMREGEDKVELEVENVSYDSYMNDGEDMRIFKVTITTELIDSKSESLKTGKDYSVV
jgi:hypothetical protein